MECQIVYEQPPRNESPKRSLNHQQKTVQCCNTKETPQGYIVDQPQKIVPFLFDPLPQPKSAFLRVFQSNPLDKGYSHPLQHHQHDVHESNKLKQRQRKDIKQKVSSIEPNENRHEGSVQQSIVVGPSLLTFHKCDIHNILLQTSQNRSIQIPQSSYFSGSTSSFDFSFGKEPRLVFYRRISLQFQQKNTSSMSSQPPNTIYVEYCRSCETHSWCTHHDEAKYHQTFLKFSQLIAQKHPWLQVIGNMVPDNLIPFKISQNKYIDINTNKYVVYPQIGSFQISFNDTLLFSKKQTSGWPNLYSIVNKITEVVAPGTPLFEPRQSPGKQSNKSQTPSKQKQNHFLKSYNQKRTHHKEQPFKGFTLTDHFKLYRQQKAQDKDWMTQKYQSQGSTKQISDFTRTESRQKSQNSDTSKVTLKELASDSKLKEMLKNKGVMVKDHGKKEMIIKLDSIEEENANYDDNGITQRTAQKSKKSYKIRELEDAFSSLQNKFINFQTKVQDIHSKKNQFQYKNEPFDENGKSRRKNQENRQEYLKLQQKQIPLNDRSYIDKPSKMDQYVNASQQQKTQKLHRIYGEWKLLKQNAKKNKRILKNKNYNQNQPSSDGDTSLTGSRASQNNNIITFKPKNIQKNKEFAKNNQNPCINQGNYYQDSNSSNKQEETFIRNYSNRDSGMIRHNVNQRGIHPHHHPQSLQQHIHEVLNSKSHKTSTNTHTQPEYSQPHPFPVSMSSQQKFKTNGYFYKAKMRKQQLQDEHLESYPQSRHPVARLVKNKGNNMSVQALRNYPSQQNRQFKEHYNPSKNQNQDFKEHYGHQKNIMSHQSRDFKENNSHQKNNPSNQSRDFIQHQNPHKNNPHHQSRASKEHQSPQSYTQPVRNQTKKMSKVQQNVEMGHFSHNAQQNIKKIQKRMDKLQERLSKHRESPHFSPEKESSPQNCPYRNNKRRSSSQQSASSQSTSQHQFVQKRQRSKESFQPQRNNIAESINSNKKTHKKNEKSRDSNLSSRITDKYVHTSPFPKDQLAIQEQGSQRDSKAITPHTHRSNSHSPEYNRQLQGPHITTRVAHKKNHSSNIKKYSKNNYHPKSSQQDHRKTQSKFQKPQSPRKDYEGHSQSEDVDEIQGSQRQGSERQGSKRQKNEQKRQKSTRIRKYELHEPVTYLRKQKQWKQVEPNKLRKLSQRISRQPSQDNEDQLSQNNSALSRNSRINDDKSDRHSRVKKGTSKQKQLNTPRKHIGQEPTVIAQRPQKTNKSYGSIKNNQRKQKAKSNFSQQSKISPSKKQKRSEEEYTESDNENETVSQSRSYYSSSKDESSTRSKKMKKYQKEDYCNQKVEGWENNTESDEEIPHENHSEEYEEEKGMRNSLDKHLDQISKDDKQSVKKNKQIAEAKKQKKKKDIFEYSCEQVICKQYSQYLRLKIADEFSKKFQLIHHTQEQQKNVPVVAIVNNNPSVKQIESLPDSFMDYNPPEQQQEEQESEQQESEKEGYQTIIAAAPVVLSKDSAHPSQVNIETTSPQLDYSESNNVYSQPVQPSKYKEIGIQKQLLVEAAIQTDQDEVVYPVLTPRTNTIHNQSQIHKSDLKSNDSKVVIFDNNDFDFKKCDHKDMERAQIIDNIYSNNIQEEVDKFAMLFMGNTSHVSKEQGNVHKLCSIYSGGTLIKEINPGVDQISTKFTNLLKAVNILCDKNQWLISRLFEDKKGVMKDKAFGVWLCKDHQWQCNLVDDCVQVDQQNQPLHSRHKGNQMWFNILEKAFASALGGYNALAQADSSLLFTMMTSCNAIPVKIKQDPTKSHRLLSMVTDCLRKNYIIHATKNFDKNKQGSREPIYYINSIRKGREEQTLVEMSQDGKESFWVKLSKFVCQFNKVDVLQLRINHNFAHIDIGTPRPGKLTVIQLDFNEQGQGCVTLAYLGQTGSIRALLYRQDRNKLLKLVGQAKQRNKSSLFFQCNFTEGKYFVFAQAESIPTRIAFLGESKPTISVTEQIRSDCLKNDMAEYLPVNENDQARSFKRTEPSFLKQSKAKIRDNYFQEYLRQNFVDYMMGRSRKHDK